MYIDDSTCCDEDFTWVRSEHDVKLPPAPKLPSHAPQNNGAIAAKPPRPSGSLDRRRNLHTTRQERDSKSRSAHSLKERSISNELKDQQNHKGSHITDISTSDIYFTD